MLRCIFGSSVSKEKRIKKNNEEKVIQTKKKFNLSSSDEKSKTKCSLDLPVTPSGEESKTKCSLKLPIHEPNVNRGDTKYRRQRSRLPPRTPISSRTIPMIITCALSPTNIIDYIDLPLIEAVVTHAFECYARVIPIFFLQVADYFEADVKIDFYSGDHDGCSTPFGADNPQLAHAFPDGKIHINMKCRWSVDLRKERSSMARDLESMMLHEIGHVLGLEHSSEEESVMYPKLYRWTAKAKLTTEDIKLVQAIYSTDFFNMINNNDWKVLTVNAYFDSQSAGGGFILWNGKRQLKFAQSFSLNCFSTDEAIFKTCCIGLNFLKMHNIDQVLVLTNCIDVGPILRFTASPLELRKWLCDKEFTIKFENRYREGLKATAELAKMGRGSKLVRRMEWINWPEQMLGLLNCEARMLRHLPLDSFS